MRTRRRSDALLRVALAALAFAAGTAPAAGHAITIESADAQTAVLDGANWDKAFAGELYFDAVRPLLVRFPGLAEQVVEQLASGYAIESAVLYLQWSKQEGARPQRGRSGWGSEEAYTKNPGKWHAVAWAVRRPWSTDDPKLAPTFNAFINGRGWWAKGGARDTRSDIFPQTFGPLPLHKERPEAGIDVSATLTDPAFGRTTVERLRRMEHNGLLVRKHELYDLTYNGQEGSWFDVYSWRVGTGYMRIWVKPPKLLVRLCDPEGRAPRLRPLPPAVDIARVGEAIERSGAPSIAVPDDLEALIARRRAKPQGMPWWQWYRIRDLRRLGGGVIGRFDEALLSGDPAKYTAFMKYLMTIAPRHWHGHATTDYAIAPTAYADLLPPGVADHLKLFWEAWTHPETVDTEKPRKRSYYRTYNRNLGTMNFNCNSIAGSLLAGQLLDAPHVAADARWGLENLTLRTWAFRDGAHQEIGDTYYQAITLSGVGAIAKFARHPLDRAMGIVARDRLVEPLISAYHPGLHRIVHPQGRGDIAYQLLYQDGPYHILHTLSRKGVLLHREDLREGQKVHGVPILGGEGPPARIALLSRWGGPWLANQVDGKSLPCTVVARHWMRRPLSQPPGWHINHLGRHYALASRDDAVPTSGVTSVVAQWRRREAEVERMEELGTLMLSFGVNGRFAQQMGAFGIVHHKGKLVAMKALPDRGNVRVPPDVQYLIQTGVIKDKAAFKKQVHALHTSAAIISFGDVGERQVWVNDRLAKEVSGSRPDPGGDWKARLTSAGARVAAKDGDIIAIRDGVTYIGLIPISVNALDRDREVEISFEHPVVLVHAFLYRAQAPLDLDRCYGAADEPSAGFVLEVADATEFETFEAFRTHLREAKLEKAWDAKQKLLAIRYASGGDTLEMDFQPWVQPGNAHPAGHTALSRRVNGAWPYLPEGIHRDTPWSVQGTTGRLEKGGAVLTSEAGRRAYLTADVESGTFTAYNPYPAPMRLELAVPGKVRVAADGRLGVARIRVRPGEGKLWVDHAVKADEEAESLASCLLVFGMEDAPSVVLNGEPVSRRLASVEIDGAAAWIVPLGAERLSRREIARRYLGLRAEAPAP